MLYYNILSLTSLCARGSSNPALAAPPGKGRAALPPSGSVLPHPLGRQGGRAARRSWTQAKRAGRRVGGQDGRPGNQVSISMMIIIINYVYY